MSAVNFIRGPPIGQVILYILDLIVSLFAKLKGKQLCNDIIIDSKNQSAPKIENPVKINEEKEIVFKLSDKANVKNDKPEDRNQKLEKSPTFDSYDNERLKSVRFSKPFEIKPTKQSKTFIDDLIQELVEGHHDVNNAQELKISPKVNESLVRYKNKSVHSMENTKFFKKPKKVLSKMALVKLREYENQEKIIEMIGCMENKSVESFELIYVQTPTGFTVPFKKLQNQNSKK